MVFHVPNVPSNRSSDFFIIYRSLSYSIVVRCSWHCLVITLLRSDLSYFTNIIPRILRVEFFALLDSKYSSTYGFTKDSSGLTVLSVIDSKSWLLTSAMCVDHPPYVPSPPIMMLSENLISSPNAVSRFLPRIILYLPLVNFLTWHFHVNIFVALNSGKQKSTFTLFYFVNFRAWVSHIVFAVSFYLSFDVRLTNIIVEMIPMSNRIWKLSNFAFPLRVFIQPCRIGE